MRLLSGAIVVQAVLLSAALFFLPDEAKAQNAAFGTGICAQQYDPVCARKKKTLLTYGNSCLAANDRATVLAKGVCPQSCPALYKPVCAAGPDNVCHTYGNACMAELAGARILRNGRCLFFFRRN